MNALLHHAWVQAALVPFLVALLTAEVLLRLRLSGLALITAFAATVFLTADFDFAWRNVQHQIIWLGLGGAVLGLLFGLLEFAWSRALLMVSGSAAILWILLPALQIHGWQSALIWGAAVVLFSASLIWCMDALSAEPLRAANAASALGIAIGIALFGGASASLAQFALAAGCGAAAHLFIQMASNQTLVAARVFTLPAALVFGSIASVAALSHHLAWYSLPLLAGIPLAAWIMPLPKMSVLLQGLLLSVITYALAGGVIYFSGFHLH